MRSHLFKLVQFYFDDGNFLSGSPQTTHHGRFENAFPVWRENFHRKYKFDVEVDLCVPTFGAKLGYTDSHC